ncbi:MAG: hypothetical protein MI717_06475 [Spirochaetales bacterium]|nr:hypothetical protein [Spirochaetales bacterium]
MVQIIDQRTIHAALELREKVDRALNLGIAAETIGAALMLEQGLDPGASAERKFRSLDALLSSTGK